jgi:putative Flp pilus-assembly TadE/G-like protein
MRDPLGIDGTKLLSSIYHKHHKVCGDEGQVSIIVVLAVGLFLLMFVGFGVDMTNMFFHRQMAQNAADATCVAAGMDLMTNRTKGPSGIDGCIDFASGASYNCGGAAFVPAAPPAKIDCNGAVGVAPCQYAALNGYNSLGLAPGSESNDVTLSFPSAIAGVVTPPATIAGAFPFVQVDVYDRVKIYFSSWISSSSTQDVHAMAKCGLQNATTPVPIIVLDPTCAHAFEVSGNASVSIIGGPTKSIQVNSNNATCAAATSSGSGQCGGNGTVDLSKGGPTLSGSDFGVFGQPNGSPTRFMPGTTGHWISPAAPISDPWALLVPPTTTGLIKDPPTKTVGVPPFSTSPGHIKYEDGCPDLSGGCTEYSPGWYTNAISVIGITAIFDPGIYYITGSINGNCGSPGTGCLSKNPTGQCNYGLSVDSNGIVRPSTAVGDGSGGTLFYFTSSTGKAGSYESAFFGANAGKSGGRTVDPAPGTLANCPGFTCPPKTTCPSPPTNFVGNMLVGPCTGPYSVTDAVGNNYHGMLMWDDRANADLNGQPSMQGGGGLVLAGNLYFHNCPNSPDCSPGPPTTYNAFLNLQGTPGSSTYVFGDITTDELIEGGNGSINLDLNPNLLLNILKVALLQ